jgi:hypothetical protein
LAQQYLFSAIRNGQLTHAEVSVPLKPTRPRPRK